MSYATTCTTCGLWTWPGFGKHIDAVMANKIPEAARCRCQR